MSAAGLVRSAQLVDGAALGDKQGSVDEIGTGLKGNLKNGDKVMV